MAKAFALIRMNGGTPDLPQALYDAGEVFNYTLCDVFPGTNWGCYLCAASGAVLKDLDDLYGGFIGIVGVTDDGTVRWGELDDPGDSTIRDRLNTWLANNGRPPIPDNWTNRQIVQAIFERANTRFDLKKIEIADVA